VSRSTSIKSPEPWSGWVSASSVASPALSLRARPIIVLTLPTPASASASLTSLTSLTSTPLRRQLPSQPTCKSALLPVAAPPFLCSLVACEQAAAPVPPLAATRGNQHRPAVVHSSRLSSSIHRRAMGGELHVTTPASADGRLECPTLLLAHPRTPTQHHRTRSHPSLLPSLSPPLVLLQPANCCNHVVRD
jgi:hypothetical protein